MIKRCLALIKWIAEFVWELPIAMGLLAYWIKGYKYYALDSSFNTFPIQTLKAGMRVKVERRKYPDDPKIHPLHKDVGETFVILDIDHIAYSKKWAFIRLGTSNTSPSVGRELAG